MSNSNVKLIRKKKLADVELPITLVPDNTPDIVNGKLDLDSAVAEKLCGLIRDLHIKQIECCNILSHKIDILAQRIDKIYEILHIEVDTDNDFILMDEKKLKYKCAIDFLNDILASVGRKPINNIKEFKDVSRDDLLSDNCKKILDKHIDKLAEVFGKTTLLLRTKKSVESYIMTLLRKMLQQFNMKLAMSQKNMKNGTNSIKPTIFYSVV